jgi:tetratricopeptide (TPR) repeat protein
VALQPDFGPGHVNIGLTLETMNRLPEAREFYEQTLAKGINLPEIHYGLGSLLMKLKLYKEAERAFRAALRLKPNYPESMNNLGAALKSQGLIDDAFNVFQQAVAIKADFADPYVNIGSILQERGKFEEALGLYRRALSLNSNLPDAYSQMGHALKQLDRLEESVASCRTAIELSPDHADAHNNLGAAYHGLGRQDDAMASFQRALELRPNFAEAYANVGVVLKEQGKLEEAEKLYRQALELRQDFMEVYNNLGTVLQETCRLDEAIESYQKALSLKPDQALTHWNLALLKLLQGKFDEAWPEYEWRWKAPEFRRKLPIRQLFEPEWTGESLEGKRILLYSEQGFGDTIQFIRYIPMVAERGARVVLACQPELARLFKQLDHIDQMLVANDPLPKFDVHCALLGLPRVFKTNLDSIPAQIPYLKSDPQAAAKWRERMPTERRLKIGISWAGRPVHQEDRKRSIPLAMFAPLQEAGAWFCSLQKGEAAKEAKNPPLGMDLVDWSDDLHDFADTAALLESLDMVVTVDTAVAHLAGAMGKIVWVLLPFFPDWRWMLDREDSPWYPTLRLFRQPAVGDWVSPMARIRDELKKS